MTVDSKSAGTFQKFSLAARHIRHNSCLGEIKFSPSGLWRGGRIQLTRPLPFSEVRDVLIAHEPFLLRVLRRVGNSPREHFTAWFAGVRAKLVRASTLCYGCSKPGWVASILGGPRCRRLSATRGGGMRPPRTRSRRSGRPRRWGARGLRLTV